LESKATTGFLESEVQFFEIWLLDVGYIMKQKQAKKTIVGNMAKKRGLFGPLN